MGVTPPAGGTGGLGMSRTLGLLAVLIVVMAATCVGVGVITRQRLTQRAVEREMVVARMGTDQFRAEAARAEAEANNADDPPKFGEARVPAALNEVPVDGDRAHKYLTELCAIGPRVSGSPGMAKLQQVVTKHFEAHGATVVRQEFQGRQRSQRQPVPMCNLIASWHPDRKTRVILCSHYDTRPAAHEEPDRQDWNRPFISANDGTSGVALFMELAHHLKDLPTAVGVDVVLFDGEEWVFDLGVPGVREGDAYFLGSEHFAREYDRNKGKLAYTYKAAILLDLCCADGARLAVEGHSWQFAPRLVEEVWRLAERLGAKSFRYERGFRRAVDVLDDHLALNMVGIPAIDVIDFDYPHWHKLSDTPDKVSAKQLAEVGRVLAAWVQTQK
jgi:hypothetical protein